MLFQRRTREYFSDPKNARVDLIEFQLQAQLLIDDWKLNGPNFLAQNGVDFEPNGLPL